MPALVFAVLFLGWVVGANVAANVFATAVASRMVRFATAAVLCAAFIIIGGFFNGAAAMAMLGQVGEVDTLAAAVGVATASAFSHRLHDRMGRAGLGGAIGHRRFNRVSMGTLWSCPALASSFASRDYFGLDRHTHFRRLGGIHCI